MPDVKLFLTGAVRKLNHTGQQLGTIAVTSTPATPGQLANVRQNTFSLDEGLVVLQWPAQLSKTSFEDLKDWMELQLRKISRSVQSTDWGVK